MDTATASAKLETVIHDRMSANAHVVQGALDFIPRNRKAPAERVQWHVGDDGIVEMLLEDGPLIPEENPKQLAIKGYTAAPLHPHAVGQVAKIARISNTYLDRLTGVKAPWAPRLAAHNLNELWQNLPRVGGKPPAHLVRSDPRSGKETIKAVVSSSYKPVDVRPILHSFLGACEQYGVQPYMARPGEINFSLKMILPKIFAVAGDPFAIGLHLSNTDWGGTAVSVGVFFERLVCLNGMTSEKIFRQTHAGARRDRDIDWSEETLKLDASAAASAMQDVVRGFFEPSKLDNLLNQLNRASDRKISAELLEARIKPKLTKDVTRRVVELFTGADEVRMPPGPSWMRAAQAVSAAAQDAEKQLNDKGKSADELVLAMERVAGDLLLEGGR